jgi:hypothetical protein
MQKQRRFFRSFRFVLSDVKRGEKRTSTAVVKKKKRKQQQQQANNQIQTPVSISLPNHDDVFVLSVCPSANPANLSPPSPCAFHSAEKTNNNRKASSTIATLPATSPLPRNLAPRTGLSAGTKVCARDSEPLPPAPHVLACRLVQ